MQVQTKVMIQDEVSDTSNDDDAHKHSKHITIDMSDITSRYQDICPLGCGANALIFSAIDQQCQKRLAVKKVALKQCTSTVVLKRLFREIRVLRQLDHDNVLRIYHTLVSTRGRTSNSPIQNSDLDDSTPYQPPIDAVYIGLELMDTDLQNVLAQQRLSTTYAKLFSYQLLRGLKYVHSANVIHRDLTPSNIFINMDTLMLKIGDFGVCRIFDDSYDHCGHLSMASSSTRYQAPELVLHPRHYDKTVDVWAAACIVAEMLSGEHLFNCESSYDLINSIIKTLPVTSQEWVSVAEARCKDESCCPDPKVYEKRGNGGAPEVALSKRLPELSSTAIDFLSTLLTFDPLDRSTASSALGHVYLSELSSEQDEPECSSPFHIEDELDAYSYAKYQQILQREASKLVSHCTSDASDDQSSSISRIGSKASIWETDSYKNLIALVHSNNQSNSSIHSGGGLTESEARTIACDMDYGVQITDGSVNRERLCMDFHSLQSTAGCFDPYKWDQQSSEKEKPKAVKNNVERHPSATHSDHGYHSSYCSSANISHGRNQPQSMWSLSSPDVSIDHDHRFGGNHRASTPDMGESHTSGGFAEIDGSSHPEAHHSPDQSTEEVEHTETKRRHKEEVLRHHHSYYHHHYHHHHHHHHHKHHRHSSRHGSSQSQQKHVGDTETLVPSSGRFERHQVMNDVVPEVVEESLGVGGKASGQTEEAAGRITEHHEEEVSGEQVKSPEKQQVVHVMEESAIESVVEVPVEQPVLKTQPVKLETFFQNGKLRTRTFSEGKARKRTFSDSSQLEDGRNIASALQKSFNHLCLGGLFEESSSQLNCKILNNCQSVIRRIRTFSSDQPLLPNINSQAFYPQLAPVPAKCSSGPLKSAAPRKQVECPF